MHIPIDRAHIQLLAGSDNYDAKMKKWKKGNKMANEIFVTMVDKKPLALIMNCENTREFGLNYCVYMSKNQTPFTSKPIWRVSLCCRR